MTDADPYEALAELAERELALVSSFELPRLPELVALAREREQLVATLPELAPAHARAALARAAMLQERTTAALGRLLAEMGRTLGQVDRARRTAQAYGIELPPRPIVDHAG